MMTINIFYGGYPVSFAYPETTFLLTAQPLITYLLIRYFLKTAFGVTREHRNLTRHLGPNAVRHCTTPES